MPDETTGGAPAQTTNEASQNVDQATPPAAEGAPAQGQPQPQGDGAQPPAQPQTAADVVPPLMGGDEPQSESAGEAPEQYEAFKGADGQEYAPEQVAGFVETAKKFGLSQEKAQEMFGSVFPVASNYLQQTHVKQVKAWAEAAQKDPEYGGAALKENMGLAKMAYDKVATPELKKMFRASGLDNHPEILRMFYRLGKSWAQDTGVRGAPPAQARVVHYPNTKGMVEDM